MGKSTMKSRLVLRNGTSEQWAEANPVLLKGELGVENDTNRFKIGDGITAWDELPYSDKEVRDLIEDAKTSLDEGFTGIRDLIKGGATLEEAKAALLELGESYKDVFAIASTLKSFLEATDTADETINKWKELKSFLDGITDAETLVGLLSDMEKKITDAYTQAIKDEFDGRFGDDVFILDGGTPEGW